MDDAEWLAQYGYRVGLRGQIVKVGRDRKRYPMRPGYIRPKDWRAAAWLTTYLKAQPDGWAWSAQVKADGIAAGYPLPMLKRARVLAGITAERAHGGGSVSIWAL